MTAASAPTSRPRADAAPSWSSTQSAHAVVALLGSRLATSIPVDPASDDAEWTAASQALVQFIQESSRPDQCSKPLLARLQSLLAQHGAVAAVAAAAKQASGSSGDGSISGDPQALQWLCCASSKELLQQVVETIWDPRNADKANRCLNAVASDVIKQWCTPDMLAKLKQDLASTDPCNKPTVPSSLFRPGAARDNAADVPPWSMDMPQAVDVARYQGLLEDQRVTTSKQIQSIFEQDDRLRCFKLSTPKSGLGIKLHWISILHSYRKVLQQKAQREQEQRAQREQEQRAQREREQQRAQREQELEQQRAQRAQELEQKAQAQSVLETKQQSLPAHTETAQEQNGQPGETCQADLASRSPILLGRIKEVIIQACQEKAFKPEAASDQVRFQRDLQLRQVACSQLLEGFCKRHRLSGQVEVQAADLANYNQAAAQLGSNILGELAKRPDFKHIPNPTKGYLQVLMGASEKQKHLPGDCISSTSARPFRLTMMQGCDWRVQFNVDFIWEAAGNASVTPMAAACGDKYESSAPSGAGAVDSSARAGAANGAKLGRTKLMKHILGSSSNSSGNSGLNALPVWVLLKRIGILLPLSTNPEGNPTTKQTLIFHLTARAVLSALANSMLPDADNATPADVKNVLVSRHQVSTFVFPAARLCESIQNMLTCGSYSQYAWIAGEGPTRGFIALIKTATSAESETPIFRTSAHADRCTYFVGLEADWIWVGADDANGLRQQPVPSQIQATDQVQRPAHEPASAAAAQPEQPKAAAARFAGIKLDPALEAQLSELPAASYKSLVHAAAVACAALDIVSKFKEHSKGHASANDKENKAMSANAGGAGSISARELVEDRIFMQAAVEVLLEGYYRTFKTETIPAVKLAKYAPSFPTMVDKMCKTKLHLSETSTSPKDKLRVVQALRSCIQAQASGRELPLLVLTTVSGVMRASLTVQRLWACLPQPAVKEGGTPAAQGSQAAARPAGQPGPVLQQQPTAQQPPLRMAQPFAGAATAQPMVQDSSSAASNGQPQMPAALHSALSRAIPGLSHPASAFNGSAATHPPGQAPAAWEVPGTRSIVAPPSQAVSLSLVGPAGSLETACAPPAATSAADFLTMLQEGLPAEWHSPSQLMEFWQVLLGAVDLVWPLPRPDSASSQDFSVFMCNVVAKHAVGAGIQHHLRRLAQQAGHTQPEAFAVRLQTAGQAALAAWQAAGGGIGHGGSGAAAAELLLSQGPLYAGAFITAWHQEQPVEQAPLLRVLNMAETELDSGAAVVTVARLDAAGLLDLASSIRFADELALDLLL